MRCMYFYQYHIIWNDNDKKKTFLNIALHYEHYIKASQTIVPPILIRLLSLLICASLCRTYKYWEVQFFFFVMQHKVKWSQFSVKSTLVGTFMFAFIFIDAIIEKFINKLNQYWLYKLYFASYFVFVLRNYIILWCRFSLLNTLVFRRSYSHVYFAVITMPPWHCRYVIVTIDKRKIWINYYQRTEDNIEKSIMAITMMMIKRIFVNKYCKNVLLLYVDNFFSKHKLIFLEFFTYVRKTFLQVYRLFSD